VKYKGVFFDLDGTLVDTAPDLVAALNWVCHQEGAPQVDYAFARTRVSEGATALIQAGFPCAQGNELIRLRDALVAYYQSHIADESCLFPGLETSLFYCAQQQIPWGVITNKPFDLAEQLLQGLALAENCSVLFGGDSFPEKKPHPRPLLEAANKLGLQPSECVYIGDHARDIQAAKAAGMASVSVEFGYHPQGENPRDWQADFHIQTPDALLATLKD
jgi:phosphoglycolate phosphatase